MPVPSNNPRSDLRGMWVNDFDLTRIGFAVTDVIDRHRAGLSFPDRTTALPGRVGTVALAREFESMPRRIRVEGTQISTSSQQLVADVDELKRRVFMGGNIEVRFSDEPTRMFLARCDDVSVTPVSPSLRLSGKAMHRVSISLLCQDPLGYDVSGTIVAFSTVKGECPVGTAPSLPTIRIFGPSTGSGFVLTYRDHAGNSEHTMTLSGAAAVMSSTENIQIDCELATITHSDGTNLLSVMSTGSVFFSLDPQDAAGSTGPYPTVEINAAGVSGDILYRRAWL